MIPSCPSCGGRPERQRADTAAAPTPGMLQYSHPLHGTSFIQRIATGRAWKESSEKSKEKWVPRRAAPACSPVSRRSLPPALGPCLARGVFLVRQLHKVRVAGVELHAGNVVGPHGCGGVVAALQLKLAEDGALFVVEVVRGLWEEGRAERRCGGKGGSGAYNSIFRSIIL